MDVEYEPVAVNESERLKATTARRRILPSTLFTPKFYYGALFVFVIFIIISCSILLFGNKRSFDIVLLGDSLVSITNRDYGLCPKIQQTLRDNYRDYYNIRVSCTGVGGNCALDLKNRVQHDVLSRPSTGLFAGSSPPPNAVVSIHKYKHDIILYILTKNIHL